MIWSGRVTAQYENVWVFGNNVGLDFNSGSPVPIATGIVGYGEASASVCNAQGKLLFYTEGSEVWNRNHRRMPNGINLTGINSQTYITSSTSQGALIVPMLDSPDKYYIFSLTAQEQVSNMGRLYYSVVDMSLNDGLGDIIPGRKGIFLSDGNGEKLTAVVGDRCNIWVLVCTRQGSFKSFEITTSGVNSTPVLSNMGIIPSIVGRIMFSSDGRKVAMSQYGAFPGFFLFDFDLYTGIVSNVVKLDTTYSYYGVAFSPDNTKLYGSYEDFPSSAICQFDLAQSNPATTKVRLGNVGFTDLKLAPDKKIYFNSRNFADGVVGSINFPNRPGVSCQYNSDVLLFPNSRSISGFPNVIPVLRRDTASSVSKKVEVCFNDQLILYVDTSHQEWNYTWEDGTMGPELAADSSGDYLVHYFTPSCTYHIDTFKVFRHKLPIAGVIQGCKENNNSVIWITPAKDDTVTYHYRWTDISGQSLKVSTGRDGDSLLNINPSVYKVSLMSAVGCDTILTMVVPEPSYNASFTSDTAVCEEEVVEVEDEEEVAAGTEGFSTITAERAEPELDVDRASETLPSSSSSSSSTVAWCNDGEGVRLVLLVVGVSWPRGSASSTCGDAEW